MVRGIRMYTGQDGNSLMQEIEIDRDAVLRAKSIQFRETPPHSSRESHTAPIVQFVIMLAGVVEFTGRSGMKFTAHPGDVLLVEDMTGSGHAWSLIGDDPWIRACVTFAEGAAPQYRALHDYPA